LATAKGAAAYPGTMVIYAAVPTTGLPPTDAKDYAAVLRYVATKGQTPGLGVGDLPPGYLPLTKANGLGELAGYTWAAANAVAAQKGALPPLTGNPPAGTPSPTQSSTPTPTQTQTPNPPAGSGPTPAGGGPVTVPPATTPSSSPPAPQPTVAGSPPDTTIAALGRTLGIPLGGGGLAVVLILGIAIVGGIAVPTTYFAGRKRGMW
jgi:hypothetical protein